MSEEKLDVIKKKDRFFVETNDGFDGTAQGYGYKSKQALYKAYWYFKNKGKLKQKEKDAKKYLNENKDVKEILDWYLSESECFYRMKDGEETSFDDLLSCLCLEEDKPELLEKMKNIKHLWKSILKLYNF